VTPVAGALRGAIAFLLLPLSLVPLYFAIPKIRAEVTDIDPDRAAFDSPVFTPTQAQLERWKPLPVLKDAVPVLAYHGVNERGDHYSLTPRQFAAHVEMLDRAGFETITPAEYVRFLHGMKVNLPERPILITFDDGRLDSYRGADRILAEHGFRATMFVIAGFVEETSPFYLTWDELRTMADSKRWDLQEHAGVGHVNVRYDAAGHEGPAYAYRRYDPGRGLETFGQFKRRVQQDILWAKQTLTEKLPGFSPLTFAVPFGSYGQDRTNDARIPRFMSRFLRRHFQAVFMTDPPRYSTPSSPRTALPRIELNAHVGADVLYRWLRERIPVPKPKPKPKPVTQAVAPAPAQPATSQAPAPTTQQPVQAQPAPAISGATGAGPGSG
jgi:peptidoglycan/xylan/chitin deacetylase (PgdA/CDA1 family)